MLISFCPISIVPCDKFREWKLQSEVKISHQVTEVAVNISFKSILFILNLFVNFSVHVAPSFLVSDKSLKMRVNKVELVLVESESKLDTTFISDHVHDTTSD
jgi:hypothetical protein